MSDREENPLTLASLRARPSKARSAKSRFTESAAPRKTSETPQLGLLFSSPSTPPEKNIPETPTPAKPAAKLPLERRIWSVRALVSDVRQHIESGYTDLWVEGEISNCRPAPSGHIYFTLKDGEAQLPVVLFRRQAQLLRFRPADGLAVLVRGRISIYETRGQLQLIAETMEPRGAGALQLAFEQLKARLLAEGLFDAARKRPLPPFPHCVGIVTSPTGAVVRDIVNVTRRRHARLNLLIYPAAMQGPNCPSTVAAGIRWFNQHPGKVDLIILARGGGSIEDLAGFNDELLARVIASSQLPIVSAIGHETDFTIADFVSDLRAPTPSAAAELVTSAQHRIEERVLDLERRSHRAIRFHLLHARQRLARLSADSVLLRLRDSVSRRDQHLDELHRRLEDAIARRLRNRTQRLESLTARLLRQDVALRLANARHRLQTARQRLLQLAAQAGAPQRHRLARASARLEALSPLAVLQRGYALAYSAEGTLLRSATETAPHQTIRVRLGSGSLTAEVEKIDP
ncbi:exodeoxyribonuclease VII large subunit [Granulicella sp. dw_53]|uniref:exodeoxyribonuclease VII large subunit n=1 Tax=Granulicella sp. dw_53 TaxID=2719792 RepID=UPI001BD47139|nr:exodeoxyribonuclease VII large subunit [Granulicella sp. dw_53]